MQYNVDLTINSNQYLSLAPYENYHEDLQRLITIINNNGRKTILWNHARGFALNYLTEKYAAFENTNGHVFSKPCEALRFVINRPQRGVDYIFEDFHHFLGSQESLHPNVGEVRSLVKELSREFLKKKQTIFFFVPTEYKLPAEMEPFFRLITSKKNKSKKILEKYGVMLNDEKIIKKNKPLIGYETYISRITQILSQMETNNPLLIGKPGVGKTAAVEGFARELYHGNVPESLKNKMLYRLSLTSLVAGTKFRGDFEKRLEDLMNEVLGYKDQIILFIDEIHSILNAGSAEGSMSASDILKPVLARGDFPCIGATTIKEVEIFEKDRALFRRFKKIIIHEPSPADSLRILKGVSATFEKFHNVKFDEIALMAAIDESMECMPDEYFPGKAIALLDSTAAYCKMMGTTFVREDDVIEEAERMTSG
ncbi:magnetosome protein Mad27-2 [Candidatus Magnetomorum sp. HK-1]|nr:magnetosome protein Mad27-2 [Candidatus Magnetomorum sp. HK-1]